MKTHQDEYLLSLDRIKATMHCRKESGALAEG